MITSINLKAVASYDPVNGVQINDLKKVNFFFGFNGSGKSTVAKYLHNLSLKTNEQNTDYANCSNVGYDNTKHHILTFNEDFIEENFNRNQELKGVFSLNQANDIIDKQIETENDLIKNYESLSFKYQHFIEKLEIDKQAKYDDLLSHCWNQRTVFSTFSKISLAYSGSRLNHFQEVNRQIQNTQGTIFTLSNLTATYQRLYENEIRKIGLTVSGKIYRDIRELEIKIDKLLQEVIIGNEDVDIASLIQTLNSRNWVEAGVTYLDKTGNICPFCQNETVDRNLIEQFNLFFDETYKKKIAEIEGSKNLYKQKTDLLLNSLLEIQNVFNPNNLVSNSVIALKSLFEDNIDTIQFKLNHSNERKSLISLSSKKLELSSIVKAIKENDQLYSDLDSNKQSLLIEIWKYIAAKCETEINDFELRKLKYNRITTLANQLKTDYDNKVITSRQAIESLRNQTINTKEAVDNINIILKNSGFEGFEIDERNKVNNISRYYLKRPNTTNTNSIFKSLSEGEKNFISFLYFFQLCVGTDDIQSNGSKKKIIVIDDPVSSLDSQALFVVATLIHDLIRQKGKSPKSDLQQFLNTAIDQVYVLTHNQYFYKEVSFDRRPICTDWWHLVISKINNKTKVVGDRYRKVFDDYSLLWKSLKDVKAAMPGNATMNILIANTMRRIIDSYVNFIGIGKDTWAVVLNEDKNNPEYYIKCAFISTINDESHKITALDGVYYQKIINEQPQILFDVFISIFKSIGKEHYEMMMDEQI